MSDLLREFAPPFTTVAMLAPPAYLLVAGVYLHDALRHRRERRPCINHVLKAASHVLLGLAALTH